MQITPIYKIQGEGLWSPLAGQDVTTEGVVIGRLPKGYYIQSPEANGNPRISDGLFVYSPDWKPAKGALVHVYGRVDDYVRENNGKPLTQIRQQSIHIVERDGPKISPFVLSAENCPSDTQQLAEFLNSKEGMLMQIDAGAVFIAPSNAYGDYVLTLPGQEEGVLRSSQGGVLLDKDNPLRWFPGFRLRDYSITPKINVGATLTSCVQGPLHYRVEAYQITADDTFSYQQNEIEIVHRPFAQQDEHITVMTLNGFNLDTHVESRHRVMNADQDVDDDWGDGRFHGLVEAIAIDAGSPDIVALQEIQDNDGAEITEVADASRTYLTLVALLKRDYGVSYKWIDIAPQVGEDGGQPGGNIRNGFLYRSDRIDLVADSVRLIGAEETVFEGSRKPLMACFREQVSGKELVCINIHLASKRHQNSIFAPEQPGYDARLDTRVEQAKIIHRECQRLLKDKQQYYVTGDFNDTEHSDTLMCMKGDISVNLVESLVENQRFDYNHRGKLQVLMHGLVAKHGAEQHRYQILHGNELKGVTPGNKGEKASDHAYVLASLALA